MNENLNLTKILEGCEGIELWSPVCGYCILDKIMKEESYPIIIKSKKEGISECFTEEGTILKDLIDAECLLFPSKDQRDWSKFVRPIKEGTPVMCFSDEWKLKTYSHKDPKDGKHYAKVRYDLNVKDWEVFDYPIMVRIEDFNPYNLEESLKHNIQK